MTSRILPMPATPNPLLPAHPRHIRRHLPFQVCWMAMAAACLWVLAAYATAQGTDSLPAPEDQIIYQIFIDRFDDGSAANNQANPRTRYRPSDSRSFHGGDIAGIRRRLSYIRNMGFNAIWMTPHVENVNNYHGYAAYNWYNVEPNFGTMDELRALVQEANALGIAIHFDLVGGHMGDIINSSSPGYPNYLAPPAEYTLRWRGSLRYPAPFNDLALFHAHGHIQNYFGIEQEIGELSGLDDLKTETLFIREEMSKVWQYWIEQTGVNGFRVDTVKHVDRRFWEHILPRLRQTAAVRGVADTFFIYGEIYGADDAFMRPYLGDSPEGVYQFDGAVDFQYYFASNDVFARADAPPSRIINRLLARASQLPEHHLMMPNFIDNHDVRRFMNVAGDVPGSGLSERIRRLELALVFLFTAPGPPIVYYGTEQDFDGGNDPFNREDMFDGLFEYGPSLGDNFRDDSARYRLIQRLSLLRNSLEPLRRGDLTPHQISSSAPGIMAFSRRTDASEVLVIINTSISQRQQNALPTSYAPQTLLINAMNPSMRLTVGDGGVFPARPVGPQAAEIWITQDLLPPLPPEVILMSPADGEANVPIEPSVRVGFSQPMDRSSVEASFIMDPTPFISNIQWNDEDTEVRFSFAAPLEPRSFYSVTLQRDAVTKSGERIASAANATWRTGRGPEVLPPIPEPWTPLIASPHVIAIDGDGSEWQAPEFDAMAENTGRITAAGTFIWKDAEGDDRGPGTYTYPEGPVFSGSEADLVELRIALSPDALYFYLRPRIVNPESTFLTTYWGMAVNTTTEGRSGLLGYDQQEGGRGATHVELRGDLLPDFEIIYTGPRGASVIRHDGIVMTDAIVGAHRMATGEVELRIPRELLGFSQILVDQQFDLVLYTGLEEFGSLREVGNVADDWTPGGGAVYAADPDVFDLAGAATPPQLADLSDYDEQIYTQIKHSVIPLRLWDQAPVEGADCWIVY